MDYEVYRTECKATCHKCLCSPFFSPSLVKFYGGDGCLAEEHECVRLDDGQDANDCACAECHVEEGTVEELSHCDGEDEDLTSVDFAEQPESK